MIIQLIIGHYSDQTLIRLRRQRSCFFVGGIIAAVVLILMPNAVIFANVLFAVFVGTVSSLIGDTFTKKTDIGSFPLVIYLLVKLNSAFNQTIALPAELEHFL